MFNLNEKIMLSHKLCTGLLTILIALPFISHADETQTDEARADKVYAYFDNDGDGVQNDSEKATAKLVHNVIDYNDNGKINRAEFRRAKHVHSAVDKNDDGKIGPREYKHTKNKQERIQTHQETQKTSRRASLKTN